MPNHVEIVYATPSKAQTISISCGRPNNKEKVEFVFQKDEPIIKPYEKQKYIYLVTRGEIAEEWK